MRSTPTTYTVHITRAHATRPHTTLAHMPQSCTLHSHTPYAHMPHVHTPLFCSHAARQCVTAWVKRQNIPQSSVGFASGSSGSESLLTSSTCPHIHHDAHPPPCLHTGTGKPRARGAQGRGNVSGGWCVASVLRCHPVPELPYHICA